MEQEQNAAIQKILEYTKDKAVVTWDEIAELVGQDFTNSPEMEEVLQLLNANKIQLVEPAVVEDEAEEPAEGDEDEVEDEALLEENEAAGVEDESEKSVADKEKLVNGDKESSVDDPIRLYLREIGKENLLTADQEVDLSKKMEDGKNIIKTVILNSGIMIPEFFAVAQKAFTRIDIHEPGRNRKEINEEIAEKRRLKSCYSEYIKPVLLEMKQYMTLKKQLFETNQTSRIFDDPQLVALREKIQPQLQKIDIQTEELDKFNQKFLDATQKIE
ncbi:MAG: RNA polymerase sigma factor RpoD, partial [Treponemataceae bacterium]|nr:RNA polymerase sigma factor RpoD [Treponemataceae bacterium]